MYRYTILIWNAADSGRAAAALRLRQQFQERSHGTPDREPAWRCVASGNGFAAYEAGARLGVSESRFYDVKDLISFGTVFRRDAPDLRHGDGREPLSLRILARNFIQAHWGRYVALISDAPAGRVAIVRDPSGMLPCYLLEHQGVLLAFSDLEDCLPLKGLAVSIDWDYVAAAATNCALHTRATGLREVSELLPGECVEVHAGRVHRSLLWHPLEIARSDVIGDVRLAQELLGETTRRCVDAWVRLHPAVLHCLSGGLDSSILLACLARSRHRPLVTCLTYYAHGKDADERPYARLAAQRGGVALIERELAADQVRLERLQKVRRSPRPGYYVVPLQRQRLEAQLASRVGARAIFSGGGGDAVFYQGRADLALADRLRRMGSGPGRCAVALAAARITGRSLWSLFRSAIHEAWATPPPSGYAPAGDGPSSSLLTREAVACAQEGRWLHPWLENSGRAPPGKRWHALSLAPPANYYDSFDHPDDPERVYPLLSQPLVEVCLRTRTELLIAGGWDRATARSAFAADLPEPIVKRRAKGGVDHLGSQILRANLPFAREMLLDGLLVHQRILDRDRLAAILRAPENSSPLEHNQILHEYLCIEAWARRCAAAAHPQTPG